MLILNEEKEIKEIADLYFINNKTLKEISEIYDVCPNTIKRVLKMKKLQKLTMQLTNH